MTSQVYQFGKYELLEVLGEGGMARVYRAVRSGPMGFRKEVALKQILPHVAKEEKLVRALINEARLGGFLRHRNVVEVYEFDQVDDIYYIAMEYVSGFTLDKLLHSVTAEGPLPRRVLAQLALQMCAGLEYAHTAVDEQGQPMNLIHRDLKPANVMIEKSGTIKIMDFGIARAETNLFRTTTTSVTKGTPVYMSPEQVRGDPLDCRSDLFSMGSVIAETITGEVAFQGTQLYQVLQKVARADISEMMAKVSQKMPQMLPVLERAFQQDPAMRYQSAGEMRADIQVIHDRLEGNEQLDTWFPAWFEAHSAAETEAPAFNLAPPPSQGPQPTGQPEQPPDTTMSLGSMPAGIPQQQMPAPGSMPSQPAQDVTMQHPASLPPGSLPPGPTAETSAYPGQMMPGAAAPSAGYPTQPPPSQPYPGVPQQPTGPPVTGAPAPGYPSQPGGVPPTGYPSQPVGVPATGYPSQPTGVPTTGYAGQPPGQPYPTGAMPADQQPTKSRAGLWVAIGVLGTLVLLVGVGVAIVILIGVFNKEPDPLQLADAGLDRSEAPVGIAVDDQGGGAQVTKGGASARVNRSENRTKTEAAAAPGGETPDGDAVADAGGEPQEAEGEVADTPEEDTGGSSGADAHGSDEKPETPDGDAFAEPETDVDPTSLLPPPRSAQGKNPETGKAVPEKITTGIQSDKANTRANAVEDLEDYPCPEASEILERIIKHDPDADVRKEALGAGEERGTAADVRMCIWSLRNDSDASVRLEAAKILSDHKDPASLRPLCRALIEDPSADVRSQAAKTLANIGDASCVPLLQYLEQHEADEDVRSDIADAIEDLT